MNKTVVLLIVCWVVSSCNSKKLNAKNSYDRLASSHETEITEKHWCFRDDVFILKRNEDCYLSKLYYEDDTSTAIAKWKLTGDTLLIFEKLEAQLSDTAAYKILNLSSDKLTIRLVKEFKKHVHGNYLTLSQKQGDEATFSADTDDDSFAEKYLIGQWSGGGPWVGIDLEADGKCHLQEGPPQCCPGVQRLGRWTRQDHSIIFRWTEIIRPHTREEKDDEGEHTVWESSDGYDTLRVISVDTLHILRKTTFRLFTKEQGMYSRKP